jgi:glutamate formiminotransferase
VSQPPVLLAVPNVSEGSDPTVLDAIGLAYARAGARLLDVHSDPDHGRSVFTLAAPPRTLADALVAGAREAVERIDLRGHAGLHPHVGAVDVAPVVFLEEGDRGAACAEALVVADRLAEELDLPVFLYGELGGGRPRAELRRGGRPRAELRRGGLARLAERLAAGELRPDFGPPAPHPSAGATLVAARPPLVAFNLELAPPATLADARRVAAAVREGGEEGLPGVRALGLELAARGGVAQVSCNVEDHRAVPLARLLEAVERHAPVAEAELVGLAPRAAFAGWPERVPIRNRATVEDALGS